MASWNLILQIQHLKIKKRLKTVFNGKNADDLEGVLFEEIKRLKQAEAKIENIHASLKTLQKATNQSIQRVGFVRYNPFRETGGDQSFAIALLDSYHNGIILSSLYTAHGVRVYSKAVAKGKPQHTLSREEDEALKKAKK